MPKHFYKSSIQKDNVSSNILLQREYKISKSDEIQNDSIHFKVDVVSLL